MTKLTKVLKFCNTKPYVFTWKKFCTKMKCTYPSTETNYLSMLVNAQYLEKTGHGQYQVNIFPAVSMGYGQLKRESDHLTHPVDDLYKSATTRKRSR